MMNCLKRKQNKFLFRLICVLVNTSFGSTLLFPPSYLYAQTAPFSALNLPLSGTAVPLSSSFDPVMVRGLTVYPDDPFHFDLIVDTGDEHAAEDSFKDQAGKLIKYFLASLTVPDKELWVNLSPYEKDRIIPQDFGYTQMGRDLLAQDYILKQVTASLTDPQTELGKDFWDKIHAKIQSLSENNDIPLEALHKIWIIPGEAVVYEHKNTAFIVKSHLKVMMEEDYEAMSHQKGMAESRDPSRDMSSPHTGDSFMSLRGAERRGNLNDQTRLPRPKSGLAMTDIIKQTILPAIEREVNEGQNFANVRQIFHAMILATWYKQNLRQSILGQVYVDQNKTKGIDTDDKNVARKIYDQYLETFKKGAYDLIKEEYDPQSEQIVSRKYFSGGYEYDPSKVVTFKDGPQGLSSERAALVLNGTKPKGQYRKVVFETWDIGPQADDKALAKFSEADVNPRPQGGEPSDPFVAQRRAKLVEIADKFPGTLQEIWQRLKQEEGYEDVTFSLVHNDYYVEESVFHDHPKVEIGKKRLQHRPADPFVAQRRAKLVEIADKFPGTLKEIWQLLKKEKGYEDVTYSKVRSDYYAEESAFNNYHKVRMGGGFRTPDPFVVKRRAKLAEIADGLLEKKKVTLKEIWQLLKKEEGYEDVSLDLVINDYYAEGSIFHYHSNVVSKKMFVAQRRAKLIEIADKFPGTLEAIRQILIQDERYKNVSLAIVSYDYFTKGSVFFNNANVLFEPIQGRILSDKNHALTEGDRVRIKATGMRGRIHGFPLVKEGGVFSRMVAVNLGSIKNPNLKFYSVEHLWEDLEFLSSYPDRKDRAAVSDKAIGDDLSGFEEDMFFDEVEADEITGRQTLSLGGDYVLAEGDRVRINATGEEGVVYGFPLVREGGELIQVVAVDTARSQQNHDLVFIPVTRARQDLEFVSGKRDRKEFAKSRQKKLKEIADGLTEQKTFKEIHQLLVKEEGYEGTLLSAVKNDYKQENSLFHDHPMVLIAGSGNLSDPFVLQRQAKLVEIADRSPGTLREIYKLIRKEEGYTDVLFSAVKTDYYIEGSVFFKYSKIIEQGAIIAARRAKLVEIADRSPGTLKEIWQRFVKEKGYEKIPLSVVKSDYSSEISVFYRHPKVIVRGKIEKDRALGPQDKALNGAPKINKRSFDHILARQRSLKRIADKFEEPQILAQALLLLREDEMFKDVTMNDVLKDYIQRKSRFYHHPKIRKTEQQMTFNEKCLAELQRIVGDLKEPKTMKEIYGMLTENVDFKEVTFSKFYSIYYSPGSGLYKHSMIIKRFPAGNQAWQKIKKDKGIVAVQIDPNKGGIDAPVGGIDFDPQLLDLQIRRDENDIPLPMDQQPIQNMHIEGIVPIIIGITPVDLPLLLGLFPSGKQENHS